MFFLSCFKIAQIFFTSLIQVILDAVIPVYIIVLTPFRRNSEAVTRFGSSEMQNLDHVNIYVFKVFHVV